MNTTKEDDRDCFYEISLVHDELDDADVLEHGGYNTTVKLDRPFDINDEEKLYDMIYNRVFDTEYSELLRDVFKSLGYEVRLIL